MGGQSGSVRIDVALVGCGRWGRLILRDLQLLGCVVHVVTPSEESRAAARHGGAASVHRDLDTLPPVEGVVVATPTMTHAAVVESVLGLGVPVFVEKPMTADPVSAQRLVDLAGDRIFVMDKWRYLAGVGELARLVPAGAIGRPHGLATTRVAWGNPHTDVDCVWILAPHDLSIAIEVFGGLGRPAAAVADHEGDDVTGLTGLLQADGWWHRLVVSSRSPASERRVEVFGTDGVAVLAGGWEEEVVIYRGARDREPRVERIPATGELPLLAELRAFVTHLAGGPPPRSSAADGLAVVEAIHGLRSLAGLR